MLLTTKLNSFQFATDWIIMYVILAYTLYTCTLKYGYVRKEVLMYND